MKTKGFLITGGAGFIGSSLADELLKDPNNTIIVVDNLLTGKIENLDFTKKNLKFIKGDINSYKDISSIFACNKIDYVFHYAAVVGVKRTLDNPLWVLNDIEGFKNILLLCKNYSVKRIFYSSSSEVYGEPFEIPQNERTTPLNARLPYAVVKNLGEVYLKSYFKEFGLEYTIFRFFNTYGVKQSEDFVITKFITKSLKGEDICVYGKGDQTRTFCYISDNIEATLSALKNKDFINKTVNIGNDNEISILNLAKLIIRLTKSKSKIKFLPALEEGDMTRRKPDIAQMKILLNRNFTPLETGLKKIIESFN